MRWHSLGWRVERVLCWWFSALHATCQSQHHLFCTGHTAQPVHPALQMKEQSFTESSSSGHMSEKYHDTSQGCDSGESPHGFCCASHSLSCLDLFFHTLDGGFSIGSCQGCCAFIQLWRSEKQEGLWRVGSQSNPYLFTHGYSVGSKWSMGLIMLRVQRREMLEQRGRKGVNWVRGGDNVSMAAGLRPLSDAERTGFRLLHRGI